MEPRAVAKKSERAAFIAGLALYLAAGETGGKKAIGVLYDHLTPAQRMQLRQGLSFEVVGNKTGRTYTIDRTGLCTYFEKNTGFRHCYNAYVRNVPPADNMLAQKLAIEANEKLFLQKACCSVWRGEHMERRVYPTRQLPFFLRFIPFMIGWLTTYVIIQLLFLIWDHFMTLPSWMNWVAIFK